MINGLDLSIEKLIRLQRIIDFNPSIPKFLNSFVLKGGFFDYVYF